MSRLNMEGARLDNMLFGAKNKRMSIKQTLGGTFTIDDDMPSVLYLDPGGASRSVVLPAEADGLEFTIVNTADADEDLTILDDASAVTFAILERGMTLTIRSNGTTWYPVLGSGAASQGYVLVTDAATYTVLKGNSGKTHIFPNLTADITVTLPTPTAGERLEYTFIYAGAAADAQDWLLTTGFDVNFFKGGLLFIDQDGDVVAPVYSDGNSNSKITVLTPEPGTEIKIWSDGITWYVHGQVFSATVPTFADQ